MHLQVFDRKIVAAVLQEWFKTMNDLPAGIRQAVELVSFAWGQQWAWVAQPLRADTSCNLGKLGLRFIPIWPNMEAWMLPSISVECQICLPITLEYVKLEVNIFVLVNLPCWWCLWPCLLGETGTYKLRADGEIFVSQCKTDSLKGHITNSSSICL